MIEIAGYLHILISKIRNLMSLSLTHPKEFNNMNISDYKPPKRLKLTPSAYERVSNSEALGLTKHDSRRVGRYQVREALVAVHNAFHNCEGTDPHNGMPLKGEQLKPMNRSDRLGINFTCKG